jgi:hypothetical protein
MTSNNTESVVPVTALENVVRVATAICCPKGCMVKGTDNHCAAPGFEENARAAIAAMPDHSSATEELLEGLEEAREYIAIDYGCGVVRGIETAQQALDKIDSLLSRHRGEGE